MNIPKLIKLDFYTLKPLRKFIVGFLVLPIILGLISNLESSIILTVTFSAFILNIIFSIAEKNNFNNLYGVLPIKKTDIILSRYIFSLIVVVCISLIAVCIYIVLSLIVIKSINWNNCFIYLIAGVNIAIFFISIQYPIFFKLEYSKAAIMSILPYIVCFAIGVPLVQNLMKDIKFYNEFINILMYFQNNIVILALVSLSITLILLYISYKVALVIVKN